MENSISRRGFFKKTLAFAGALVLGSKIFEPPTLEAIVYYSPDDGLFISHSVECDQLGTGDTREEAIEDLGIALSGLYYLREKDETIRFYRDAPSEIQTALKIAKSNPDKYNPIVQEVPGYFRINNYDLSKELVFVDYDTGLKFI